MNPPVTKRKVLNSSGHVLEIGGATWDESEIAVRNRYPTKTGGFSPRSSSELPLYDIKDIVYFISEENLFLPQECVEMIQSLLESISRQTHGMNKGPNG